MSNSKNKSEKTKLTFIHHILDGRAEGRTDLTGQTNPKPRSSNVAYFQSLPDLICLSHLRWDFVYQRPQHLLTRCASERRVYFVEEPVCDSTTPRLEISSRQHNLWVVVPHLPAGLNEVEMAAIQQSLLIDELLIPNRISEYILWYYTPMALSFTRHLEPLAVVYDCMDELSAFKNAPVALREREAELMELADVVFTGGHSLYEAKKHRHPNIHPFPSSIDRAHFGKARNLTEDPADQAGLPHPRLGFFGVVDERMDIELLAGIADARPDWQLVVIGPVVKIDPASLPQRSNIHYLGGKSYQELPAYLAGWDIALLPFARNEATRFISPTKTPEYLAAGVPVISTSIRDVVRPYGQQELVQIADTAAEFVKQADFLMSPQFDRRAWLKAVEESLASNSWDRTWGRMMQLINSAIAKRAQVEVVSEVPAPSYSFNQPSPTLTVSPVSGD